MIEKAHFVLPLEGKTFHLDPRARQIVPGEQTRELAECMLSADLALVDYAGESVEEMMEELDRAYAGAYGPYIEEASLYIPHMGEAVSAVITTLKDDMPLIAFVFTREDHGRRGLSKALLSTAFYTLKERGYSAAHLYCDPQSFAIQLYRALGFERAKD